MRHGEAMDRGERNLRGGRDLREGSAGPAMASPDMASPGYPQVKAFCSQHRLSAMGQSCAVGQRLSLNCTGEA